MAIEELMVGFLLILALIPMILLIGLTGIKLYSWGRQTLLESESQEKVQTHGDSKSN